MVEGKTPVVILQELMAMLTTRKEACEKILSKNPNEETAVKLNECLVKSDEFISELMGELTQFGDSVMGEVNRDNEYQNLWRNALKNIDTASDMELYKTFLEMEKNLTQRYNELTADENELPVSLQELLQKQVQEIPAK
jgi:hypothetical protein